MGNGLEEELEFDWLVSLSLVLFGGLMSGLTVGLFSIDSMKLQVLSREGTTLQKQQALALIPVISKHHRLLVTLLISNAVAMETLPLFLNRLVPSWLAILLSVTLVLVFGEVIPQALCTKNVLAIGSRFVWLVHVLMFLLTPLNWPIGKLLDWLLGEGESRSILFKRSQLKTLVDLHVSSSIIDEYDALSSSEARILKGTLDIKRKTAADCLTPWTGVFCLFESQELDDETVERLVKSGFSRVPVINEHGNLVIGIALVKRVLFNVSKGIRTLQSSDLCEPIVVESTIGLLDLMMRFLMSKSHIAIVVERDFDNCVEGDHQEPQGIVTFEDILEEMLQTEIKDEFDLSVFKSMCKSVDSQISDNSLSIASRNSSSEKSAQKSRSLFKSFLEPIHSSAHEPLLSDHSAPESV
jgi:CBS domain containing-hemolysin-like protein